MHERRKTSNFIRNGLSEGTISCFITGLCFCFIAFTADLKGETVSVGDARVGGDTIADAVVTPALPYSDTGNTDCIVVDAYGGNCGDYFLEVSEVLVEHLECPDDADLVEGEPLCGPGYEDTYNCGCGCAGDLLFLDIPTCPGQITICGESGTFLHESVQYRDTDWYQLDVEEGGEITICGIAEYPALFFIIEDGPAGDCNDFEILQTVSAQSFEMVCMAQAVQPGVYWLWSAPVDFEGVPCGADYIMTLDGYTSNVIAAGMTCLPPSGTVPFTTQMTVSLSNLSDQQTRRIAGRIDVALESGASYSNWKSGWTNVAAGSSYTTSWNQAIPEMGSVIGDNIFLLAAEDVTPSPYNHPPYPPAGDTVTDVCTVEGRVP